MAELIGILKFKGKLNGLSFYKMNGKIIMRKSGGFDGEKILRDEKYVNVRKNASEFGRCSKFGGKLRRALQPFVKDFRDPILHGRVAKMLHDLMKLDPVSSKGSGRCNWGCNMVKAGKSLTILYGTPVTERDAAMIMKSGRCFLTVFLPVVRKQW